MLPLKTLLFLALFSLAVIGSIFYHPVSGIIGYIFMYHINPVSHWWWDYIPQIAYRYAFIIAAATSLGFAIHFSKLKWRKFWHLQEFFLFLFVALIWVSIPLGYNIEVESHAVKMGKILVIILLGTHIVTTLRLYEAFLWTMVIAGLFLGIEMFNAPAWQFIHGRFQSGVGGSDFAEGNFLAAHFAMLLPFVGVLFLKSVWKYRALCFIAGMFMVNSIVQTRSRGVFLALLMGGIAAVYFAPRELRKKVAGLLALGLVGIVLLADPGFWQRMTSLEVDIVETDSSAAGRVAAWKAAWSMAMDHPLGVGEGNFKALVERYNPLIAGKDTHNTFFRCLAELGFQGFLILMALIANAFLILRRLTLATREVVEPDDARRNMFLMHHYAVKIALVVFLTSGMFITHTYIEEFYWLLVMPVFLYRSWENEFEMVPEQVLQRDSEGPVQDFTPVR